MKIYILADMEGISGIRRATQVDPQSAEYHGEGRSLMMREINVAIEAAFAAGATEVVACDTHASGGQVRVGEMDARASYETPGPGRPMPSLDGSFSGVILLGHHARAGTLDAFLDHTMDSSAWFEFRINEAVVGEIGIEAAWAGHHDVPVIMVSGDATTEVEARATLGDVETAVVKWGIGRQTAKCLSLPRAHEVIAGAVRRAVERAGRKEFRPYKPKLPAEARLTLYRSDMADGMTSRGWERVDARTVKKVVQSMPEMRW
ncbi:MAG: M55 family metallopeptidase [Phycisphaeraceae bacterium]|nr:M55 family metallopeptidase [Phycisphaeraceae bacterium]